MNVSMSVTYFYHSFARCCHWRKLCRVHLISMYYFLQLYVYYNYLKIKNSIIKKETSEIKKQRYILSHETQSFWYTLDVPNAIRVRAEFQHTFQVSLVLYYIMSVARISLIPATWKECMMKQNNQRPKKGILPVSNG